MRCLHLGPASLAAPLFLSLLMSAENVKPNFTGAWRMDSVKSQVLDGRVVTLTIQDDSTKLDLVSTAQGKDAKEVTSKFACTTEKECEFDQGGYKAKVSLWYDGATLVILKTDGPKEDAVTKWKLHLTPDGNTLTLDVVHIDPDEKPETLVFTKKPTT
jgi:hypothetical protein